MPVIANGVVSALSSVSDAFCGTTVALIVSPSTRDAFHVSTFPVTAHEDWTVFDVIGRLELRLDSDRKEEILPVNGYFTEAVIRCANAVVRHFDEPSEPQAEWLLIDELNRAHMDRAFGEQLNLLKEGYLYLCF